MDVNTSPEPNSDFEDFFRESDVESTNLTNHVNTLASYLAKNLHRALRALKFTRICQVVPTKGAAVNIILCNF